MKQYVVAKNFEIVPEKQPYYFTEYHHDIIEREVVVWWWGCYVCCFNGVLIRLNVVFPLPIFKFSSYQRVSSKIVSTKNPSRDREKKRIVTKERRTHKFRL